MTVARTINETQAAQIAEFDRAILAQLKARHPHLFDAAGWPLGRQGARGAIDLHRTIFLAIVARLSDFGLPSEEAIQHASFFAEEGAMVDDLTEARQLGPCALFPSGSTYLILRRDGRRRYSSLIVNVQPDDTLDGLLFGLRWPDARGAGDFVAMLNLNLVVERVRLQFDVLTMAVRDDAPAAEPTEKQPTETARRPTIGGFADDDTKEASRFRAARRAARRAAAVNVENDNGSPIDALKKGPRPPSSRRRSAGRQDQ